MRQQGKAVGCVPPTALLFELAKVRQPTEKPSKTKYAFPVGLVVGLKPLTASSTTLPVP
jgi:hypothetical protein